jgi:hypothetical protein
VNDLTRRFHNFAHGGRRRDEDTVAHLFGETDALARARAVEVLGTDDEIVARMTAADLRGRVRRTGTLSPEDAERLVAAEILLGTRTEIGREVERLIESARSSGLL